LSKIGNNPESLSKIAKYPGKLVKNSTKSIRNPEVLPQNLKNPESL